MKRRGRRPHPDVLTPREWEVLALLRDGLSNEEIAERLGISLAGAKYHVSEILSKLGVSSREDAARWEPARRPWWLAAGAPIGALWQRANASWLSTAVAAGLAVVVAAGLGVMVWALVRVDGGGPEGAAGAGQLSPPAIVGPPDPVGACPDARPLPGDGVQVFAYEADGTVWVADADGGESKQVVCGRTNRQHAAWSPSGRYLAYIGADGSLRLLDVETWDDTVLDDIGDDLAEGGEEESIGLGRWSSAGELLAYRKSVGSRPPRPIGIWVAGPETAGRALVERTDFRAFDWSPDGSRLVYQIEAPDNLLLVNADGSGGRSLTRGLLIDGDPWSPDGRLLAYWSEYRTGTARVGDIRVMEVESGRVFSLGEFTSDEQPQWSPDASRYVFHNLVIDPETGSASPLFDRPGAVVGWSPDGSKVAYVEGNPFGPPPRSLVVRDIGSGEATTLHTNDADLAHAGSPGYYGEWSPDGRYYAFVAIEPDPDGSSSALYIAETHTGEVAHVLDGFAYGEAFPSYSPDSNRLLIQHNRFQQPSIWLANADGSGLVRFADGSALRSGGPAWRPAAR